MVLSVDKLSQNVILSESLSSTTKLFQVVKYFSIKIFGDFAISTAGSPLADFNVNSSGRKEGAQQKQKVFLDSLN